VGVGGIGAGIVFALEGTHDLGRNESRPARLLDARDYCKLHIVAHYPAVLLGARPEGEPFHVLPVGRVGADEVGTRVRGEMAQAGMDTRFVQAAPGSPTLFSVCFLYPDGSGGNITTACSAASAMTAADVDGAAALLDEHTIALAVPEAPLDVRGRMLAAARARGALRVAAFASAEIASGGARAWLADVDLLALNEDEAATLAGTRMEADPRAWLDRCAAVVLSASPEARLIVTAGRRGAWTFSGGAWTHCPALPVEVASTAGAGDALLGGVLTGLTLGLPFARRAESPASLAESGVESAIELGSLVAACSVTSPHTIPPDLDLDALVAFASRHGVRLPPALRPPAHERPR
jgi:sugar/nucleoside kinase (ribokinase family)